MFRAFDRATARTVGSRLEKVLPPPPPHTHTHTGGSGSLVVNATCDSKRPPEGLCSAPHEPLIEE